MKIFILEDDLNAMTIVEYLREQGRHIVDCANNLLDATYLLSEEPGINYYDAFLFDAEVPKEKLSFMGRRTHCYGEKYGFAGVEFLVENYDLFSKKKVSIVTAYRINLIESTRYDKQFDSIISKLPLIDKSSNDFLRQLASFLSMK